MQLAVSLRVAGGRVIMFQVAGGRAALEHGGVALPAIGLLSPSGVRPLRI